MSHYFVYKGGFRSLLFRRRDMSGFITLTTAEVGDTPAMDGIAGGAEFSKGDLPGDYPALLGFNTRLSKNLTIKSVQHSKRLVVRF
jgi:hypothetical protein